jgi:hypothetical protein
MPLRGVKGHTTPLARKAENQSLNSWIKALMQLLHFIELWALRPFTSPRAEKWIFSY